MVGIYTTANRSSTRAIHMSADPPSTLCGTNFMSFGVTATSYANCLKCERTRAFTHVPGDDIEREEGVTYLLPPVRPELVTHYVYGTLNRTACGMPFFTSRRALPADVRATCKNCLVSWDVPLNLCGLDLMSASLRARRTAFEDASPEERDEILASVFTARERALRHQRLYGRMPPGHGRKVYEGNEERLPE